MSIHSLQDFYRVHISYKIASGNTFRKIYNTRNNLGRKQEFARILEKYARIMNSLARYCNNFARISKKIAWNVFLTRGKRGKNRCWKILNWTSIYVNIISSFWLSSSIGTPTEEKYQLFYTEAFLKWRAVDWIFDEKRKATSFGDFQAWKQICTW